MLRPISKEQGEEREKTPYQEVVQRLQNNLLKGISQTDGSRAKKRRGE